MSALLNGGMAKSLEKSGRLYFLNLNERSMKSTIYPIHNDLSVEIQYCTDRFA